MVAGLLSDRAELESLFDELADELARLGTSAEIVMVGGAWMLWHSQRVSTRDVDSARRFDPDVSEAIDRVGKRHDLRQGWLNDAAASFWPLGASYDDCEIVYQLPALVVRSPAPDVIFVMKMYRADPQDREDLVTLWPLAGFAHPDEAAHSFRLAYPHAPEDEHLASYIADVAIDAENQ
ncbi:hypothetical protein BH23ACT5_BH23ACT5_12450 [soil metagenome]